MTTIDRRTFLMTGTAGLAGAAGALAVPGVSPAHPSTGPRLAATVQTPGFYRFPLGDLNITVLGDGSFQLPAEIFGTNVTAEQRTVYYESRMLPHDRIPLSVNPVVIDTGHRRILVDAGTGPIDAPSTTGRLPAALAAAGIAPQAIDLAIVTHAHPDHLGGLADPATGAPLFPSAEVVLSETEHAFWTAADVMHRPPTTAADRELVEFNHRVFATLGDRVRTIPMEGEVTTGIHSVATPGHTPGHIAVLVSSGSEQLIMLGDAIVTSHTHFEQLEWRFAFDFDPDQAVRTRRRLLDRIATDRLLVQGFHLPFPGVGHAVRDGSAYRWLPTS